MLVQPALTTHLLCRPVSIADSRVLREELQVLCEAGELCYVCRPAESKRAIRKIRNLNRAGNSTSQSSFPLPGLHQAARADLPLAHDPREDRRPRFAKVHRPDSMRPALPLEENPRCDLAQQQHAFLSRHARRVLEYAAHRNLRGDRSGRRFRPSRIRLGLPACSAIFYLDPTLAIIALP